MMKIGAITVAGMLLTCATAATAQSDTTPPRALEGLSACRTVTDDTARLACFDKAAATLDAAVKAKDVRVVDRGDMRKAKRSLFGFNLPRIDLFGTDRDGDPDAFVEINSTVAYTRTVANNRVEIGLTDEGGAVWQTTDPVNWPPKKGAKIRIRQGAMGNYFLSADGGMRARGMRLR